MGATWPGRIRGSCLCGSVALFLAACTTDPAPTALAGSVPALVSVVPPTLAAATSDPPLVPAFPTATVAFSGAGPLAASSPFPLRGGTYRINWNTWSIGPGWTLPTWSLVGTIHDAAHPTMDRPLVQVNIPAGNPQAGIAVVDNIPAGTYVLDVTAPATCGWTLAIHP